ncbi:MAG: translation initiation factor IF-2 [Deltaproteobacteria bacterium]|nr:MAG: translation initiation factor IF-2 [Deltaproteobacteria bacterium]
MGKIMKKIRLLEVAKQLNTSTNELISFLQHHGEHKITPISLLEPSLVNLIHKNFISKPITNFTKHISPFNRNYKSQHEFIKPISSNKSYFNNFNKSATNLPTSGEKQLPLHSRDLITDKVVKTHSYQEIQAKHSFSPLSSLKSNQFKANAINVSERHPKQPVFAQHDQSNFQLKFPHRPHQNTSFPRIPYRPTSSTRPTDIYNSKKLNNKRHNLSEEKVPFFKNKENSYHKNFNKKNFPTSYPIVQDTNRHLPPYIHKKNKPLFPKSPNTHFKPYNNLSHSHHQRKSQNFYSTKRLSSPNNPSYFKHHHPTSPFIKKHIELAGPISIHNLALEMTIKANQLIAHLMNMGVFVTVNQTIDLETASIIATELGYEIKNIKKNEEDLFRDSARKKTEHILLRPPIVTIMGHVDHGKTTLLDTIKNSRIVDEEFGGITQQISGFNVSSNKGLITFIDTPGHEAFYDMRARGAQVTDIIVLVVAANEGVMPQTLESIKHAKSLNIPIIVAINKIDTPNSNPDKVLQQLANHDVITESWGGEIQCFEISALKNQGIPQLLEGIITLAEVLNLKANFNVSASGYVLESRSEKGKGQITTLLVQKGILKKGDIIIIGEAYSRVKVMHDQNKNEIKIATPSMILQSYGLGLSITPKPGNTFNIISNEKTAKTITQHRLASHKHEFVKHINLDKSKQDGAKIKLSLIIKANTYGSLEAIINAIKKINSANASIEIIHFGIGTITENDISLAKCVHTQIIGFCTKIDSKIKSLASQNKVDINTFNIIYDILDFIKKKIVSLEPHIPIIEVVGYGEIREIFSSGKNEKIAGVYISSGKIQKSYPIRIKRNNKIIHEGHINSLKRFKEDLKEVSSGLECGISILNFHSFEIGDILECISVK